ncbi:MAG: tetratricopeptide repeat protein [Phycisphaeraceae bacterium]|nr:tetratricopeptide repeat protein [Phycisphaeraceae bacterium]MCB9847373.1 tetratricopeptide repeat protein [Phycisphaeraceae bacterium]
MSNIPLPQLLAPNPPGPGIKRSRNAVRRAVTLVALNALIIAHIIQWKISGRTVSPVEPSEAMYTLERGLVNAGFIFLVLAMFSVLVAGRFVCGWGCHIVALQDWCGWIMKKLGVRPRQFRTRLLGWAPLLLALYMFVWPTVEREAVVPLMQSWWPAGLVYLGDAVPRRPDQLINATLTDDFWKTFAGIWVAIPFLLVIGFASVYFLGAKGFCAYGCPYGGFFGVLDKLSVGRIVVDHDRCQGCGHCTAACTSNVRVHEEIREFGMVVSPGCMKDMDCVSVCPNEALSFRFAKPSILKGKPRDKAPRRVYDCSLAEELFVAVVFAAVFYATRGAYGMIPMLFAVGLAGCGAFLAWKAWRVLRDRDVRLHSFQLKRAGGIRPSGWALIAVVLLATPVVADAFLVKAIRTAGDFDDRRVAVPGHIVFQGHFNMVQEEHRAAARRGIERYELAKRLSFGLGAMHTAGVDGRLAWLRLTLGQVDAASAILTKIAQDHPDDERRILEAALVLRMQERYEEAMSLYRGALTAHPEFGEVRRELAGMLIVLGRDAEAETVYRDGVERTPDDTALRSALGLYLVSRGRSGEAIPQLRRVVETQPESASAHNDLAVALFELGSTDRAVETMERACELDQRDPHYPGVLAQMLDRLGRAEDARRWWDEATRREAALAAPRQP